MRLAAWMIMMWCGLCLAQAPDYLHPHGGGGYPTSDVQCLTDDQRSLIMEELAQNRAFLRTSGTLPAVKRGVRPELTWPVAQNPRFSAPSFWGISNYVDHNTTFPDAILDYNGGTRTYDTTGGYNHQGVDLFLWPFPWAMMARDQGWIVAAAPGTIVFKRSDQPDQNCSFGGDRWNVVIVDHDDGSSAWYGHMKTNSLTTKGLGERVERGEFLGLIGSSGNSTGPHLHFEIYDADGNLNDPYAGPFNTMNQDSWWREQPEYFQPKLLHVQTHHTPPDMFDFCPEFEEVNGASQFQFGDIIYFGAYLRDQLENQESVLQILRPDDTAWNEWFFTSPWPHVAGAWWYWNFRIGVGNPTGSWIFRVTFEGETLTHFFAVGDCSGEWRSALGGWPNTSDVRELVRKKVCDN